MRISTGGGGDGGGGEGGGGEGGGGEGGGGNTGGEGGGAGGAKTYAAPASSQLLSPPGESDTPITVCAPQLFSSAPTASVSPESTTERPNPVLRLLLAILDGIK